MSLYNYRWQQARRRFLQAHPLCAMCLKRSPPIIEVASVVDHIVPHRGDEALFWDESNWQALCKPCHDSRKQHVERGGKVPPHASWDRNPEGVGMDDATMMGVDDPSNRPYFDRGGHLRTPVQPG